MRAMPGLRVIRPADANEAAQAWRVHIDGDRPDRDHPRPPERARCSRAPPSARRGLPRGAYVLVDETRRRSTSCSIGTGSEVSVCVEARDLLAADGPRCGSCRCRRWELFDAQDDAYRDSVLPPAVPKLAVEAGASFGWDRYADDVVAIDHFGASAPGGTVLEGIRVHPRERRRARTRALLQTGGTR